MPTRAIKTLNVFGLITIAAACSPTPNEDPSVKQPPEATRSATPVGAQATAPKPGPASALTEATTSSPQGTTSLTRVEDSSLVCMVNNQYMGRPQIPVVVEGRTYFGCCEMCKGRLERDQTARFSTDPVSGRRVDKATAVIGRDVSNRVLYFENETTYRQYLGT